MAKLNKVNAFLLIFVFSVTSYAFSDVKTDIYSKLKCCPCEVSFEKCVCPEAKEMKAYIDALLEAGLGKEDIFYKVAKKFSLNTILDKEIKLQIEKRLIAEAGKMRPQIISEPTSFNFGKASKKEGKIRKIFKLYNQGNADLIVNNIRVSCSCVNASLKVGKNRSPYFGIAGAGSGWQETIGPGKSGELEVVLDLAHSSIVIGKQTRDIFIATNDPLYPEMPVRVEIEVRE